MRKETASKKDALLLLISELISQYGQSVSTRQKFIGSRHFTSGREFADRIF